MVGQRIDGDGHRMKTSVTGLENYNYPPCHSEGCAQLQNMPTITEKGVEVASVMCVQNSQEGLDNENETAHTLGVGPMETEICSNMLELVQSEFDLDGCTVLLICTQAGYEYVS